MNIILFRFMLAQILLPMLLLFGVNLPVNLNRCRWCEQLTTDRIIVFVMDCQLSAIWLNQKLFQDTTVVSIVDSFFYIFRVPLQFIEESLHRKSQHCDNKTEPTLLRTTGGYSLFVEYRYELRIPCCQRWNFKIVLLVHFYIPGTLFIKKNNGELEFVTSARAWGHFLRRRKLRQRDIKISTFFYFLWKHR